MLGRHKVRVNSLYRYQPVLIDHDVPLETGTIVRVINLHGCPPANTMGHCYIEHLGGEFIRLVCTNSLQKPTMSERKMIRRVLTRTKHRIPSTHYIIEYGAGVERT